MDVRRILRFFACLGERTISFLPLSEEDATLKLGFRSCLNLKLCLLASFLLCFNLTVHHALQSFSSPPHPGPPLVRSAINSPPSLTILTGLVQPHGTVHLLSSPRTCWMMKSFPNSQFPREPNAEPNWGNVRKQPSLDV
jgi:hypothetical protein